MFELLACKLCRKGLRHSLSFIFWALPMPFINITCVALNVDTLFRVKCLHHSTSGVGSILLHSEALI